MTGKKNIQCITLGAAIASTMLRDSDYLPPPKTDSWKPVDYLPLGNPETALLGLMRLASRSIQKASNTSGLKAD